jgi:hypothetical protein
VSDINERLACIVVVVEAVHLIKLHQVWLRPASPHSDHSDGQNTRADAERQFSDVGGKTRLDGITKEVLDARFSWSMSTPSHLDGYALFAGHSNNEVSTTAIRYDDRPPRKSVLLVLKGD